LEDLWSLYKTVYARTTRTKSPITDEYAKNAEKAARVVAETESLTAVDALRYWENLWLSQQDVKSRISCADRFENALISGVYTNKKPYVLGGNFGRNPIFGSVYVALWSGRPDEVKVGATSMDIDKRLYRFRQRYGVAIELHERFDALYPFKVETFFQKTFQILRVRTNAHGESNEWYQMKAETAIFYLREMSRILDSCSHDLNHISVTQVIEDCSKIVD
jgi:hypothetical protein